jgi:repressor LexA
MSDVTEEAEPDPSKTDELLTFITNYINTRGFAPSTREMAEGMGMKSVQGVHRYLARLKENGKVDWEPNRARTLRVIDDGSKRRSILG